MTENINRAFMYGESVFTTMRMVDAVVMDWNLHFDRLKKGAEFLYGPFTETSDWTAILKNALENRFQNLDGDKIIRLTVVREQQGRALHKTGLISITDLKIHVQATELDQSRFENKNVKLRTCPASKRPNWWPPFLKAGNYLETILYQKKYLGPQDDDLLFLSEVDTVLESSVANIFVVRHNKIYTAPAGPNVLEGIMRRKVIDMAPEIFEDVVESETTIEQLLKADAIFGSNSVRGLFLVDRVDDYEICYGDHFLTKFNQLKNKVWQ